MKTPLVSVIMGIYNCEDTLVESIESIINQSYANWEIIMCDDCSKDNTYNIAKGYSEKYSGKIKVIRNEKNLGLAESLNHCLRYVKGDFVARMDGDDKSLPNRFEVQVKFLMEHEEYDLIGTSMLSFNDEQVIGTRGVLPCKPNINKIAVAPPFCHATIMTRAKVYRDLNGYRVTKYTRRCEDIDLWFRFFSKGFKGYNLSDPLYMVRDDENSYNRRNFKSYFYAAKVCLDGYRLLKLPYSSYIYILKPVIASFVPTNLKKVYHSRKIEA